MCLNEKNILNEKCVYVYFNNFLNVIYERKEVGHFQ